MPLPAFLARIRSLPKGQRVALGAGAVAATGAGLYSWRRKRTSASTSSPAASSPMATALSQSPDLSQYGQVAVLVPIDWQDGANFGGAGGLTGPLTPTAPPPPVTPTIVNYPAFPGDRQAAISGAPVVGGGYANPWRALQSFGSPAGQAKAKQLEPNPAHVRSVPLETILRGQGVGTKWGGNQPFDTSTKT